MNTKVIRAMIAVIKREQAERIASLPDNESGSDRWLFNDEPFVNDLAILALIALWHSVERDLIRLSASISQPEDGILDNEEFKKRVARRKMQWNDRPTFVKDLRLETFPYWHSIETLRLLANTYKHEPFMIPSKALLNHLDLPLIPKEPHVVGYSSLPDSHCFREGLARSLNMDDSSDYTLIAARLADHVDEFIGRLRGSVPAWIQRAPVSLIEFEC
jgi:hypothetical protein